MEFLLEPPKSPDYGPPKSDESDDSYERRMRSILGTQPKKAEGVDDDVKVINIKKDDTSNNEQLIGEDLSLNIPELESENSKLNDSDAELDFQIGGELTSVDLDDLIK